MTHDRALRLAEAYVQLRRGARALEVLKDASPEDARTWLWRANALQNLERYAEAAESAERGLRVEAESPYLYAALARARMALMQFDEAERAIRESLRLDPYYAEGHSTLAVILSVTKRPGEAAEASQRAMELGPEERSVRNLDVLVKVLTGRKEDADELSREVLAGAPDDPGAHYVRAIARASRGDARGAARHYRHAARLEPDNRSFVKAARVSGHWLLWPLRLLSPAAWRLGCVALSIALIDQTFFHPGRWTYVWCAVAYLAYVFVATVVLIGLPARE